MGKQRSRQTGGPVPGSPTADWQSAVRVLASFMESDPRHTHTVPAVPKHRGYEVGEVIGRRTDSPVRRYVDSTDRIVRPTLMEDSHVSLLKVRGLVKTYGRRRVVDGVDFEVDPGEIVGLLGPNGAGKTTSFRMACGMIDPDAGH